MNLKKVNILSILYLCFSHVMGMVPIDPNNAANHHWLNTSSSPQDRAVGEFGFPSEPMNERARGYLLKGKAQAAITNYGRFIDWDHHPPGLWGNYTYLPAVGFVAGIPGQSYTNNYSWKSNVDDLGFCTLESQGDYVIWCSSDAYWDNSADNSIPGFSWYEVDLPNDDINANYVSVVFEAYDDDGILGQRLCSPYQVDNQNECIDSCTNQCDDIEDEDDEFECYNDCYNDCITCYDENNDPSFEICNFDDKNQFCVHDINGQIMISLDESDINFNIDPNNANVYESDIPRGVGFVYPWAMRPALNKRLKDYDFYQYGLDGQEWTKDDEYDYYGSNVAESWFTRLNPSVNTDWQASEDSRENSHNTNVTETDIFGDVNYLDISGAPVLAHSDDARTWPLDYNEDGELVPTWPGWFAESYSPDIGKSGTGCNPKKRYNDDCWITTTRFISDSDIYMEFDDRWAHRGNMVNNNEYQQTGYPMGLRVMAEAHSYGVEFAEDILFVTVQVRNESGDGWCAYRKDKNGIEIEILDNNGDEICGNAMIMPDGTKLNGGKGFTYKGTNMGFYMDADVVTSTRFGNFGVHTNEDDFMEYYDCKLEPEGCDYINDDYLRVSIAMIYDYDFKSGSATDIGIVATQLLDSPFATEKVQLTPTIAIEPGEKLKMTDWHWYSWYNRPGVVFEETSTGYAGDPGKTQARNKEDIMYKIISGDPTNLTDNERHWFFHTDNPAEDDHEEDLNPHFDSLDGLAQTTFFLDGEDGLDCVLQMSSGPFSLGVGEQVPFSFCVIWGQNREDLLENAKFAQLMYNSHYQGYTAPDTPTLTASLGDENTEQNPETGEYWYDRQHHCINLSWDDVAENSTDVVSGYSDFEGYNIYKSMDSGITWGDSAADLYDTTNPDSWFPYATFHLTAEQDMNHCTFSNDYHQECSNTFPMYYVENDCFSLCEDNLIDDDELADCFSSSPNNPNINLAWETCISDNCGTCIGTTYPYWQTTHRDDTCSGESAITVYDYSTVLYIDDLDDYTPIYKDVNCNYIPWCVGKTCADSEDLESRIEGDHIRAYDVCGKDENNAIAGPNALGQCYDLENDIGIIHTFTDCEVIDGMEYTYAVTAFDMGIAKSSIITFDQNYGVYNASINTANPLAFAAPDGYESIQTSRGRSVNDKNFITIEAGPKSTRRMSNDIKVVPNPYFVYSNFNNETEYTRNIRFINLPEKCRITIFTISGEKVISFVHDEPDEGSAWWNVRTLNNQEVAPGLYVFAVENLIPGYEKEKFIGKFAVVR